MDFQDLDPPNGSLALPAHADINNEHNDLNTMQDNTSQTHLVPTITGNYANGVQEESATIKEEDSDSEFLWAKMQEHTIELSSSDCGSEDEAATPTLVKKEPKEWPIMFNDDGDGVIEVLDSDDEGSIVPVKEEPREPLFDWRDMPSEPIELSDTEDDVVVLGGSTTPPVKQEEPEVEWLWSEMGNSGVIELPDSDEDDKDTQHPEPAPVLGYWISRYRHF